MPTGRVRSWSVRGFGFIEPDAQPSPDIFVHVRNLEGDSIALTPGQRVTFQPTTNAKTRKAEAIGVRPIGSLASLNR